MEEPRKKFTLPESMGGPPHSEFSVHHPPTIPPMIENIDPDHLKTIHKFLTDMNFGDKNVDLTDIHLRDYP